MSTKHDYIIFYPLMFNLDQCRQVLEEVFKYGSSRGGRGWVWRRT